MRATHHPTVQERTGVPVSNLPPDYDVTLGKTHSLSLVDGRSHRAARGSSSAEGAKWAHFPATSALLWPLHISSWGPELPQRPEATALAAFGIFHEVLETQAKG